MIGAKPSGRMSGGTRKSFHKPQTLEVLGALANPVFTCDGMMAISRRVECHGKDHGTTFSVWILDYWRAVGVWRCILQTCAGERLV